MQILIRYVGEDYRINIKTTGEKVCTSTKAKDNRTDSCDGWMPDNLWTDVTCLTQQTTINSGARFPGSWGIFSSVGSVNIYRIIPAEISHHISRTDLRIIS